MLPFGVAQALPQLDRQQPGWSHALDVHFPSRNGTGNEELYPSPIPSALLPGEESQPAQVLAEVKAPALL